ncbi:M48 family metallopeptidase [Portibacter marinus]|uniref:M48 family metallopeptidase n=1 Tax=Portibacter marinus TaxID=2898660 RepID=UPI001F3AE91D|nr:M48 family metallopeptidase [Portibacter marinus]
MLRRRSQQGRYYGGTGDPYSRKGRGAGTSRFKIMLFIGLAMAVFQAFKYFTNTQVNPVTGETQRVQWTLEEEVALGIQAAPQMAQQYGGLYADQRAQDYLDRVGQRLMNTPTGQESEYPYEFHLLADPNTVNAFALPGGQTFITYALFNQLENEDQLAGIMGHEIGHVIERHGAERMARSGFIQGIIQSILIGAGGDATMAQIANVVGQYTSMKYGRDQELESDEWGVKLMIESGYDPEALIGVMDILEKASGGARVPEFQSSHPSPENRREKIREAIEKYENQ